MLPITWYFLKMILCSGILYGYYRIALHDKIFHRYNRFFLLAAVILSLTLPLVSINWWQTNDAQNNQVLKLFQVVASGNEYMDEVVILSGKPHWAFAQLYPILYLFVSFILMAVFIHTLFFIYALFKKYPVKKMEGISLVITTHRSTPFSFLKFIFWNESIGLTTPQGRQIFSHELVHIREKHTYDKLFINVVLIFCWCNPFLWLIRKELNIIHEFIADKKAVEGNDTASFAAMLLKASYPDHQFNLVNNFFYSPIKRRLMMLIKNQKTSVNYAGRILVLPLAILVFAAFSLKKQKTMNAPFYHGKKTTVVIDAGHGGLDAGAKSNSGIAEKDINLAIAQKIKSLNENKEIAILLVREDDRYITLQQKTAFARSNHADLFVSIHCAAEPDNSPNKHSGIIIWIPKDDNTMIGQSKALGTAVINSFKNDFGLPVAEQMAQRKENIWVLQDNGYPAILIETGFISTPSDLNFLTKTVNQEKIAENILNGIAQYLSEGQKASKITLQKTSVGFTQKIQSAEKISRAQEIKKVQADSAIEPNIDLSRALIVINGKISEKQEININETSEFLGLDGSTFSRKVLTIPEAIKKYGSRGQFGAIELIFTGGTFKKRSSVKVNSSTGQLYTGKANVVIVSSPYAEANELILQLTVGNGSVKREGNGKFLVSVNEPGMVTFSLVKKGGVGILGNFNFMVQQLPDGLAGPKSEPRIFVGTLDHSRVNSDEFKRQTNIKVTEGYGFVSADLYFSGEGFRNVVMSHLSGTSLSPVQKFIDQCLPGTNVSFDNIYLKNANGVTREIAGMNYSLCDSLSNKDNQVFHKTVKGSSFLDGKEEPDPRIVSAEIYKVPLKIHLLQDGKVETYNMAGNGRFNTRPGQLFLLNGKVSTNPETVNSIDIVFMESYDALSGRIIFGEKGKYGVLLVNTKN